MADVNEIEEIMEEAAELLDTPDDAAEIADTPLEQPNSDKLEYEQNIAEVERFQAEMEARDREFLAAMEHVLEKTTSRRQEPEKRDDDAPIGRFAISFVKKGVGVVSLSLILIIMGVVMAACLFSKSPDYLLPMKLSPIAAVLLGLELLAHYVTSGKHFRIHIPSIVISALLVVGCCAMAASLNESYSETKTEYNNRSIAAEIYDHSYKELRYLADITSLGVEVDLNPDGLGKDKGFEALSTDDIINIRVELGGSYSSAGEFAEECKKIIDGYRILGIPVTNFRFTNEGKFHSFSLDVEGKFLQDYSENRLADRVVHYYVEDFDYIDDLEDFVGETEQAETTDL